MPVLGAKKLPGPRWFWPAARYWLPLVAAGAVILVLFLRLSDPTERLLQLRRSSAFARVANQRLYLVQGRLEGSLVEASQSGRALRTLTTGLPPRSGVDVDARPDALLVSWWESTSGTPLPPTMPGPARGTLRRLRLVPLDGRPPRDLLPGERPSQGVVLGQSIFWVAPRPALPGGGPPRADLMLTPLHGGKHRRVATGLLPWTPLMKGEHRVFWQTRGDGDTPPCLCSVSEDGDELSLIEDADSAGVPPVEHDGRYYWLESGQQLSRPLHSVRTDGTDRRESLRPVPGVDLVWFQAYRGVLYGLTLRRTTGMGRPGRVVVQLNRIHLGVPAVLEPVADLPRDVEINGQFDEGYFYFVVREVRDNWLDWSPEGLSPHVYRYLHRVRLRN